jgi:hypothetical protein
MKTTHRGYMQIDSRYIENGVVEIDSDWMNLTKFGQAYGVALFMTISSVNENRVAPLECYKNIEPCKLPKGALIENTTSFRFTKRGIGWICEYIAKHPFNLYIYELATGIEKVATSK